MTTETKQRPGYWEDDGIGGAYVLDGYRWGVSRSGATVCLGPVKKKVKDSTTTATIPLYKGQEAVSKLLGDRLSIPTKKQAQKRVVMQQPSKHPGGRPRKEGEIHRVTAWRRAKQGVLV